MRLAGPRSLAKAAQRVVDERSHGTLAVAEEAVAAGERQSVLLANRGVHLDLGVEVETVHESARDHALQPVLLTEVHHLGLDDIEELGHDRGNAAEVSRTMRGLWKRVDALQVDKGS